MKRLLCLLLALCMVLSLTACGGEQPESVQLFAMDTVMDLTAYGENAAAALTDASREINRLERLLSRTIDTSEISQINAGGAVTVSEETASLLEELPGEGHLCVTGDAGVEEDVRFFAEKVLEHFGRVDVLVNNACITRHGILSGCSYEDFNEVLREGVAAPYLLSLLFRDHFSRGASIVNIASTRASMSQKDTESYSAAKGALISLTHALAMSLAPLGVRVNSISPGWIDTGAFGALSPEDGLQHPSGRVGTPEDIVQAVFFLCRSGFVNAENLVIDGGMTRMMVYHGDEGWTFRPEPPDTVPS